jgi:hypothetical protein
MADEPLLTEAQLTKILLTDTLGDMTELELMQLPALVNVELRSREVIRTDNSPIGDYAEWFVCKKLGFDLQPPSYRSCDAIDGDIRYQIKARKNDKQLSAIRSWDFEYLIAVIFDDHFTVSQAVKFPMATAKEVASYSEHTNGYVMSVTRALLERPEVEDITESLA